jgi:hypothetical protein
MQKTDLPKTISLDDLRWLLDLTAGHVQELERQGILTRTAPAQYSFESIRNHVRTMRRRGEGPADWNKARFSWRARALSATLSASQSCAWNTVDVPRLPRNRRGSIASTRPWPCWSAHWTGAAVARDRWPEETWPGRP